MEQRVHIVLIKVDALEGQSTSRYLALLCRKQSDFSPFMKNKGKQNKAKMVTAGMPIVEKMGWNAGNPSYLITRSGVWILVMVLMLMLLVIHVKIRESGWRARVTAQWDEGDGAAVLDAGHHVTLGMQLGFGATHWNRTNGSLN